MYFIALKNSRDLECFGHIRANCDLIATPGSLRSSAGSTLHIKRCKIILEPATVFRPGDTKDFERMLDDILDRAKTASATTSAQVQAESAARGSLLSSGTVIVLEQRLTPIHESALADAMRLIVQFSERAGISVSELADIAKPKLAAFTAEITLGLATTANRIGLTQLLTQASARFQRRVENSLADVHIGFIQGRSAIVTENSTNQSKALRMLQALYDATRAKTEPVFVEELNTGLAVEDAKAAWRYLKDRGLIDTFNIPYTARINGAGVDAIEGAKDHPDQPSADFPSVSYNIVYNTMNIGTMSNSPIQQGGIQSTHTQNVIYSAQDISDLTKLVAELTSHLGELGLDDAGKRKAEAQIAMINAQLLHEPDPVIINQAGRTLRNIVEGAAGSLLATAVQPTVWGWVHEAMRRLFG